MRQELTPDQKPQELLQLIETILVYKLPLLNRREIETMFSLDELKQTQYFQDVEMNFHCFLQQVKLNLFYLTKFANRPVFLQTE